MLQCFVDGSHQESRSGHTPTGSRLSLTCVVSQLLAAGCCEWGKIDLLVPPGGKFGSKSTIVPQVTAPVLPAVFTILYQLYVYLVRVTGHVRIVQVNGKKTAQGSLSAGWSRSS